MSYAAGETLVLARLQAITGSTWTSTNTSRGKWGILNTGLSDHYAILKPGPGTNKFLTISVSLRTYHTIIQVWQSYTDDGTSLTNIEAYAEAILDQFDAYRKLGDTTKGIEDSQCISWTEVEERWVKGENGPRWLKQDFVIEWKEENAVTFAE